MGNTTSLPRPQPSWSLPGLPCELQDMILCFCDTSDLARLCRTSRATRDAFLSRLYSHVDVSCHNDPGLWPSLWPGTLVFADDPSRLLEDEMPRLRRRQECFLQTMSANPSFATFIYAFTWTFIPWLKDEGEFQCDLTSTWRIFASFDNVQKIDFVSLAQEREDTSPSHLFSSVKVLRVGGQMSLAMVTSIMTALDPAALTFLHLDNLQDFGHISGNKTMPPDTNLSTARETSDANGRPILRHPGAMRGYLHPLKGKCTALKRLVLSSVGQDITLDNSWSEEKDLERYQQWADFIDSVRLSLEVLEIEQGLQAEDPHAMPPCRRPSTIGLRPMDRRLITTILPVLSQKPWPRLVRMSLRGIGGRRSLYASGNDAPPTIPQGELDDIALLIEAALPATAGLFVEHDAHKTYYHRFHGPKYGRI